MKNALMLPLGSCIGWSMSVVFVDGMTPGANAINLLVVCLAAILGSLLDQRERD